MATIPNPTKSRTWDLGTSANGTFFDTEFNQLYANDNNLDGRVESLEANVASYAKISDVKAANTDGGTATSGSWQTRTINTEDTDPDSIVSINSNQFTLAAGTYRIRAIAPAFGVQRHKAKLYNVTDSADVLFGTSEITLSGGSSVQTSSTVLGQFTIAGSKAFEIKHQVQSSLSSVGYGIASNVGVSEVYTIVEIWKVG